MHIGNFNKLEHKIAIQNIFKLKLDIVLQYLMTYINIHIYSKINHK